MILILCLLVIVLAGVGVVLNYYGQTVPAVTCIGGSALLNGILHLAPLVR